MPNNKENIIIDDEKIVSSNDSSNKHVSITEAARISNVTRQAIYIAIKLGKLRAKKKLTRWTIDVEDLENYRKQKYSRSKSVYNGELIFDNNKGYFSVNQVAKILQIPAQKVYYATRIGYMKAQRRGVAWVVHESDIENYKKNHIEKKQTEENQAV